MKISVITASYNAENTIRATIDSVLNQTYTDWELIIIDDGSKDKSVEIIQSYCNNDSRIKLYTHKKHKNKGLIETLKLGLKYASSEWVQFVECDDILRSDAIEKKLVIAKKYPNVAIIYSYVELFGDETMFKRFQMYLDSLEDIIEKEKQPGKLITKNLKSPMIPTFSAVMCKKDKLLKCSFDAPIDAYLDWYLWSQLAQEDMYCVKENLTQWRISSNSYYHRFIRKNKTYIINKYNLIIAQNIKQIPYYKRIIELMAYDLGYCLKNIFSIKNSDDRTHKVITILWIKIKIKRHKYKH